MGNDDSKNWVNIQYSVNGNFKEISSHPFESEGDCAEFIRRMNDTADSIHKEVSDKRLFYQRCQYEWFLSQQEELTAEYGDKYLLIHKFKVVSSSDDENALYFAGKTNFGLGNFLIQRCNEKPNTIY